VHQAEVEARAFRGWAACGEERRRGQGGVGERGGVLPGEGCLVNPAALMGGETGGAKRRGGAERGKGADGGRAVGAGAGGSEAAAIADRLRVQPGEASSALHPPADRNAHFVEMDPWVVSSVLSPNIEACSASSHTTIHPLKVESFLYQAQERRAEWVGGPFSFVSVTPPYELVVYSQLMAQLAASPLLHPETCMVVENPIKYRDEILDTCGPLYK
ncbi:unnamed protein product, partial [Closterium sp. Naga37s-1]